MIHKNLFIVQKQHNFVPRIRLQTEESPYSKFKPKRKNETPQKRQFLLKKNSCSSLSSKNSLSLSQQEEKSLFKFNLKSKQKKNYPVQKKEQTFKKIHRLLQEVKTLYVEIKEMVKNINKISSSVISNVASVLQEKLQSSNQITTLKIDKILHSSKMVTNLNLFNSETRLQTPKSDEKNEMTNRENSFSNLDISERSRKSFDVNFRNRVDRKFAKFNRTLEKIKILSQQK